MYSTGRHAIGTNRRNQRSFRFVPLKKEASTGPLIRVGTHQRRMAPELHKLLNPFVHSLASVPWFAHAGEPYDVGVVVSDVFVGWDDWNAQMLAVWTPRSNTLERMARESIGDSEIDEIINNVSAAVDKNARQGMQDYFDRRPADSENTETNTDIGLWPELLETIKRDVSWAAIETVLEQPDLFTELMTHYRRGRWPCAWHGEYPSGRVVVLCEVAQAWRARQPLRL